MALLTPVQPTAWWGVLQAFLSGILIGLGVNFQKRGGDLAKEREAVRVERQALLATAMGTDESAVKPRSYAYLCSALWWVGLLAVGIGELFNFVAYGFAPATLIAPLGGCSVIFNALFAHTILNEPFFRHHALGIGHILVGSMVIVLYAPGQSDDHGIDTLDGLHSMLQTPEFIVYMCVVLVACVIVGLALRSRQSPYLYLVLTSLISGVTVLSTKALSGLIRKGIQTHTADAVFRAPTPYILIVVMLVTIVLQIRFLNDALHLKYASVVLPIFFVGFNLSVVLSATIVFREFYGIPPLTIVMFITGLLVTMSGVFLISSESHKSAAGTGVDDVVFLEDGRDGGADGSSATAYETVSYAAVPDADDMWYPSAALASYHTFDHGHHASSSAGNSRTSAHHADAAAHSESTPLRTGSTVRLVPSGAPPLTSASAVGGASSAQLGSGAALPPADGSVPLAQPGFSVPPLSSTGSVGPAGASALSMQQYIRQRTSTAK